MPRLRVIVLEQPPDNPSAYRYVLWADVPVERQSFYANANAKSAWREALTADNAALQNGSVVEEVSVQSVPTGTSLIQVENFLQARWQAFQDKITSSNPWLHYGSTWDGSAWTVVTGA